MVCLLWRVWEQGPCSYGQHYGDPGGNNHDVSWTAPINDEDCSGLQWTARYTEWFGNNLLNVRQTESWEMATQVSNSVPILVTVLFQHNSVSMAILFCSHPNYILARKNCTYEDRGPIEVCAAYCGDRRCRNWKTANWSPIEFEFRTNIAGEISRCLKSANFLWFINEFEMVGIYRLINCFPL